MTRVRRAILMIEIQSAVALAARGDWLALRLGTFCTWWAGSAARRLEKLSGKHTENTGGEDG
ncbi:hypothetical protein [Marinibacterium profundimaris]|uniref:Uncharacterized protein n=1 Tax=Marinibacterium profundimaris TaxID=1679460 RepID=A0A225NRY9_9RHOB|nr:hypothetical protein [Marinibacterium profundimaris]OWU77613.1 hypothetical protein ATO3_02720 [Marinibacterium profundimaris]